MPLSKVGPVLSCRWCGKIISRLLRDVELWNEVPVCVKCYWPKTRHHRSDPRYRLWVWSFDDAAGWGLSHTVKPTEFVKPVVCPVTDLILEFFWPHPRRPDTDSNARLVQIRPGGGFVAGNVQVVSREAANPTPGPPATEEEIIAQLTRVEMWPPPA